MRRLFVQLHARRSSLIPEAHLGKTFCPSCIPPEIQELMGESEVEVWEEYSHGWVSAPVCSFCKLSLPVYIDAENET